jgi:hypothetical protein
MSVETLVTTGLSYRNGPLNALFTPVDYCLLVSYRMLELEFHCLIPDAVNESDKL